ncbi:MAG: hypothetical protein U5N58_11655 [Actinomycetota bacterium]|nr:hypothetical protein [Actinomycetota bacterium]
MLECKNLTLDLIPPAENLDSNLCTRYQIKLSNNTDIEVSEFILITGLPEGILFKSSSIDGIYDENRNIIEWYINNIQADEIIDILVEVQISPSIENSEVKIITAALEKEGEERIITEKEFNVIYSSPPQIEDPPKFRSTIWRSSGRSKQQ